jgi:hypothetical protein
VDSTEEPIETILTLLEQQRANLQRWPYSVEQLAKDKELSVRLRQLADQLLTDNRTPLKDLTSITPPYCRL